MLLMLTTSRSRWMMTSRGSRKGFFLEADAMKAYLCLSPLRAVPGSQDAMSHSFGGSRLLALVGAVCLGMAAIGHQQALGDSTAFDGNTSISVNPGNSTNPVGLYSWTVNGVEQAYQKWSWYRVAGSYSESSIDHFTLLVENCKKGCQLQLGYQAPFGTIDMIYGVSSEPYGAGTSAFEEQITITNTTASALELTWFEYTNLNLRSTPYDDAAYHIPSLLFDGRTWPNALVHQDGGVSTALLSGTPASAYEIAFEPSLYQSLTDSSPTTLANTPPSGVPIGPGNLAHALEYQFTIGPGQSVQVYTLSVLVPEPTSLSLLALGGLTLLRRRRSRK